MNCTIHSSAEKTKYDYSLTVDYTLRFQMVIYEKPYFTGKSRTITTNMRSFMKRMDATQTAFMFNVGSLKVQGGMWVHTLKSPVVSWKRKAVDAWNWWTFLPPVPLSVALAGWAMRRRASEATSTCWKRESTMTGGCGEAVTLRCALLEWYEL